jgi:hypothetical protein
LFGRFLKMTFRLWEIAKDPDRRAVISWLGAGIVVAASGIWAVFTFVVEHKDAHDTKGSTNITVSGQGIASGGNTNIHWRECNRRAEQRANRADSKALG